MRGYLFVSTGRGQVNKTRGCFLGQSPIYRMRLRSGLLDTIDDIVLFFVGHGVEERENNGVIGNEFGLRKLMGPSGITVGDFAMGCHDAAASGYAAIEQFLHQFVTVNRSIARQSNHVRLKIMS